MKQKINSMKNNLTNQRLVELLEFAIDLSKDAGENLIKYQKKIHTLKVDKKKAQGVVSKADISTENLIIKRINQKYPLDHILGEENFYTLKKSNKNYGKIMKQEALWVIDPLDGTHNFLNGSDYFCVSIAWLNQGVPVIGVIYRPVTKEVFYARSSKGAYYIGPLSNFKKRKLFMDKNLKKIKDAIMVTGFASEKGVPFDKEFELFKKIVCHARGVRRFGSAALDLSYVASGLWDGFFEKNLSPWDVAAAGLILIESGGNVTNYQGEAFNPFQSSIVGSRNPLFKKLVDIIGQN